MYEKEKPLRTAALGYDNDEEFQGAETVESFETIEQIISVEEVLDCVKYDENQILKIEGYYALPCMTVLYRHTSKGRA